MFDRRTDGNTRNKVDGYMRLLREMQRRRESVRQAESVNPFRLTADGARNSFTLRLCFTQPKNKTPSVTKKGPPGTHSRHKDSQLSKSVFYFWNVTIRQARTDLSGNTVGSNLPS